MNISTAREPDLQLPLFEGMGYEDRVCTVAACRNYMGDAFEELTAIITGGTRLKTDSTKDVCPDIKIDERTFLESKSIGCSGAVIVYESRLAKDLAFAESHGIELFYVLWRHGCKIAEGVRLGDLRTEAMNRVKGVIIIPLSDLKSILSDLPVTVLNAKHKARGYGSMGYNNGWRVPYSRISNRYPKDPRIGMSAAYGRVTAPFTIQGNPEVISRLIK